MGGKNDWVRGGVGEGEIEGESGRWGERERGIEEEGIFWMVGL